MDCIFCKIVNGEIPSYTIYEDELVKAFLDVNPKSNGHTLIIPKKHYTDITDIDNKIISHIIDTTRIIKTKLDEKLDIDGLSLIQNNGLVQEVKHYHLHLQPFYKNRQTIKQVEDIYNLLK